MTERKRREEYSVKASMLRQKYQSDLDDLMERRKHYTKLDEGATEEQEIRKQYWEQMEKLSNEYKDVLKTT